MMYTSPSSMESVMESENIGEKDFVLMLIALYRDHPVLWRVKSNDYMNKNKKSIALQTILCALKHYKPNYTEDNLKKKINILRTNFNKSEQKKRSGASRDDIPEPTLWYYKELLFIKDQVEVADTESSEQPLTDDSQEPQMAPDVKTVKTVPSRKRKPPPDSSTDELVGLATAYFKRPTDTESEIIAKGWAMKLNRLAADQRRYAEKIINDTLFEGELGTLTRNGVRFLPSSQTPSRSYSRSPAPSSLSIIPERPFQNVSHLAFLSHSYQIEQRNYQPQQQPYCSQQQNYQDSFNHKQLQEQYSGSEAYTRVINLFHVIFLNKDIIYLFN
ncbi:uncharacterized protein LOC126743367 [Anthonomus grandis grandis]|uniref:uncharacterized protein LOC126743367 n=1 Tax=Anthonomus grandis grandis TaxID=2921223 RepID=UPI002164FC9F|nr:uncharacterized protein LOC126743367 [Anthonomus grandis grandis]